MPDLPLRYSFTSNEAVAVAEWFRARYAHDHHKVITASWPCQVIDPAGEGREEPIILDDHGGHAYTLLYAFYGADAHVMVRLGHGQCNASAAGSSLEKAKLALGRLRESLPKQEVKSDGRLPVSFWAYTPNGPMVNTRELSVPKWEEIRDFYGDGEREAIDALVSPSFVPGKGGQLILWRGVPGTGKTTALRALGWGWRNWARLHVIADPERFFGDHADYMLGVMLGAGDQEMKPAEDEEEPMWRVLVLEDAGELLAKDSKQKVGQALSRFLNAVDGLIGQGLRFLVLVTTNEDDMGQLNEAVGRHGRAAANTEFEPLSPFQAERVRLRLQGDSGGDPITESTTLADVFAQVEGTAHNAPERKVGFG